MNDLNLSIIKCQNEIKQLIQESNLPIEIIILILKNNLFEIEKIENTYLNKILSSMEQEDNKDNMQEKAEEEIINE